MRLLAAVACFLATIACSGVAQSQPAQASSPIQPAAPAAQFTATASPSPVRSGEVARIDVAAKIRPGFHIYSVVSSPGPGPTPTSIVVAQNQSPAGIGDNHATPDIVCKDPIVEDAPTVAFDRGFGKNVACHIGFASFVVPVHVTDTHGGDIVPVALNVHYQACNDKYCLPPATAVVSTWLHLGPGPVRAAYATAPTPLPAPWAKQTSAATSTPNAPAKPAGLLGFIAAAFAAGLLALLTPCVFPLIPVTFGYFTKQLGASGRRLVALAAFYCVGIVLSFTALGLIVAASVGENGPNRIAANPWFNILFGLLFIVFGFAFFETFTPQLPGFLQRFARPAKTGSTYGTVLLMGLAFVFAAFTCTAPFVATVLSLAVTASHSGGCLRPVLGMVFFSLALALPFFVLSLFPSAIARLPRSGSWLSITKAILGFVELAFAVIYFSKADLVWQAHLLTRPVIFGIWAAIAICGALYLLGALRLSKYQEPFERLTPGRGLGVAIFALCAAYCFYAQSGRPINSGLGAFLPPPGYGGFGADAASSSDSITWLSDYDQALKQSQSSGKPVFIDFTGYTCTNCRWMELNIFPKPQVAALLGQYITVRLYTDGGADGPKNQALQSRLAGEVAQPLYTLLAPDGRKLGQSVGLDSNPAHMVSFLSQGLTATAPSAGLSKPSRGFADPSKPSPGFADPSLKRRGNILVQTATAGWAPYVPSALAAAKAAHKAMIVDFSADWCVPCHAIEKSVFPNPAVTALTPKFATYMANLTAYDSPASQKLEEQFGIAALPTIVFIDADGKEAPNTRITGIITPAEFAVRMQRTLQAKQ